MRLGDSQLLERSRIEPAQLFLTLKGWNPFPSSVWFSNTFFLCSARGRRLRMQVRITWMLHPERQLGRAPPRAVVSVRRYSTCS